MIKLDEKDRKILSKFAADPDVSQDSIAKEVGLSQPSVASRVSKLRQSGALEKIVGINPLRMGLYLAKVDLSSTRPNEILAMFRDCPYFANGFTVSGKHNLCLFFFSESVATLEAIVNGHLRADDSVSDLDFDIVITSEKSMIVPTVLSIPKKSEPPCGTKMQCRQCPSFKACKCMGCPVTGQYQGTFY
jgi:DNA-binding Lrp family transcriptional regulator